MVDHLDCASPLVPFIVSCKMWFVFYGSFLLTWDMAMTYINIPTTLFGILFIYCALIYFKVPAPPAQLITEVFGEDANILAEKYRQKQVTDLNFVPTTSRLAMTSPNTHQSLLRSDDKSYTMWIIGHRGAGLDAPENSLSAIRLCKSRGCMAVEFDVGLTKDEVPVIFHDDTLTRIAGIDRALKDMTYEEIRNVDISVNHPLAKKFVGERIPTLDEAITTCLDLDLRFFIDLKDTDPKMVQVVLDLYYKHGEAMYKRAVVSSFDPKLIYKIRKQDPKVIGCMAWRPGYNEFEVWNGDLQNLECRHHLFITHWFAKLHDVALKWALHNVLWWFLGLSALLINKDGITKEGASHWMRKGLRIFAWTVNNPVEKLHLTYNFQVGHLTDTLDGGELMVPAGMSPSSASFAHQSHASESKTNHVSTNASLSLNSLSSAPSSVNGDFSPKSKSDRNFMTPKSSNISKT